MDYIKLLNKKLPQKVSVWKRITAFIIDMLILEFFVLLPFNNKLESMIPQDLPILDSYKYILGTELGNAFTVISIFVSIFAILYFSLMEYKIGQTPGKIVMNIMVVSEGNKLKFWQCLLRSIFLIPLFPFVLLWMIDPIFYFFTGKVKRLSDVFSKTQVVNYR